jgi:hypothetical protein
VKAADLIGVSVDTLRRWEKDGLITAASFTRCASCANAFGLAQVAQLGLDCVLAAFVVGSI